MSQKISRDIDNQIDGVTIMVKVTPRAPRNKVSDILENGTIKISLTAPPVDGKANHKLLEFFSEIINIPIANIEILSGQTGHLKLIKIRGISKNDLSACIQKQLEK